MHQNLVVITLVFTSYFCVVHSASCVVNGGRGIAGKLANGRSYCSYKGIPYAEPPIGLLRFKDPILKVWRQDGNFTRTGSACTQIKQKTQTVIGNENCLFLNVYTSADSKKQLTKHPIVVWIHGGSFVEGSSETDVKGFNGFLENDIVVVTFNYRLGLLGFVSSEEHNVSGNMGLKDQRTALLWIQKYGGFFGGDIKQVTLMGWSAGSASVTYHLYSKSSNGLFHRAIAMSGSLLNPWAFLYNPGYFNGLNFSATEVVQPYNLDFMFSNFGFYHLVFIPSLEVSSSHPFLDTTPLELVKSPPANPIPLMIGYTNLEVELLKMDYEFEVHNPNFPNSDTNILGRIKDHLKKFAKTRFADHKKRKEFVSHLSATSDMYHGVKKLTNVYSDLTEAPVYAYRFAFDGDWNKNKKRSKAIGAVHGDDLGYLFYDAKRHLVQAGDPDLKAELKLRQQMVKMWSNFIKTGNPNYPEQDSHHVDWEDYREGKKLLQIDDTLKMVPDYDTVSYDLWSRVYVCLYHFNCSILEAK